MIGCMAKADSAELKVDLEEMDEVRWVPRAQAAAALAHSEATGAMLGGARTLAWGCMPCCLAWVQGCHAAVHDMAACPAVSPDCRAVLLQCMTWLPALLSAPGAGVSCCSG
jgi:hypothetical protein